MILDTTVIIDLLRNNLDAVHKIKKFEEENIPFFITSISVFEIWQGTQDINNREKYEKINYLLESLGKFTFDISAAKEAGIIHSILRSHGKIIDPEGSMIAGIARVHGQTILTRNSKHFERIHGIKVETY